jgi:FkbM family methyltransferase
MLDASSVVYSVGIGEDASFDLELADQVHCTIHAFDPTPRALSYLESVNSPAIVVHPFGLWAKDGVLRLYEPADPTHVSLSVVDRNATAKFMDLPVKRLSTIMADLGHSDLDVLKVDIEGAEAEVLRDVLDGPIRPRVLAVEFERIEAPWKTLSRIRLLRKNGYRPIAVEKNNITFIHAPRLGKGL